MSNSIFCITPYRYGAGWVFDDQERGLIKEAFVAGADTLLDMLAGGDDKVTLRFSAGYFPGAERLSHLRSTAEWGGENEESEQSARDTGLDFGNWYRSEEREHDLWLCPALYKYFDTAPQAIYLEVKRERGTK